MRNLRRRKTLWIVLLAVPALCAIGLLCVPGRWRGSSIDNPRPVVETGLSLGPLESLLQALHVRSYPPLRLDPEQEAALVACLDLSRLINQSVDGVTKFEAPAVQDQLLACRPKMPPSFYAEFLLAKWYERRGETAEAQRWMREALRCAPVVLIRRYCFMDGTPLAHTKVDTLGIECRMKTAASANTYQTLRYIDLVTDEKGQVYLPCYDTKIRCSDVQWPRGYEIEMGRHGYLEATARYSLLPTIYVWKKGEPRPATNRPPSEFYDYKDAQLVQGLTYRADETEFRIDRCFRRGPDGTVLASDGREAVALSGQEPLPSFGDAYACLDQALVRFTRSTAAGPAILQVRVFDHRSRSLLTEYHAPAAWSYDGRSEISLKSFARPLPESLDVWFWITQFDPQDRIQKVLPQVGATAEFQDYKAVLTHIHSGLRSYSATSSTVTFGPQARETEFGLQVAFQITPKGMQPEDQYARLVAVSKDGLRLLSDRAIYPSQHVFVFDFPMKLSDLDHFDLHPVGREMCFFFDGVRLPAAEDREPAQSWQVVIPTRGQAGSFATTGSQPAHLQITMLPGHGSMSLGSRQVSDPMLSRAHWTYGSEVRDVDTWSTIVCEMTGLTARMLKTEIVPLDTDGHPLEDRGGFGRSGTVVYRTFRVPPQRIDAVRVTLSWSAE